MTPDPYSDLQLYTDIVARMTGGDGYYEAATGLQRAHGYPTHPFVTVRQPTLAAFITLVGWRNAQIALYAIFAIGGIAWLVRLERGTILERSGAMLAYIAAVVPAVSIDFVTLHEFWAGALASLSLALIGGRLWPSAMVAGGLAIALRELAFPLVAVLSAAALWMRDMVRLRGWLIVIALFAAGMIAHAFMVNGYTLPGDRGSPGWNGLRGPFAPLADLAQGSLLGLLPLRGGMTVLVLALAGLAALPAKGGRAALAYCLAISVMVATFARPTNTYWMQLLMPTWFIGIAFIPRAVRDLAFAIFGNSAPRSDRMGSAQSELST